jgi:hypothetical protein
VRSPVEAKDLLPGGGIWGESVVPLSEGTSKGIVDFYGGSGFMVM